VDPEKDEFEFFFKELELEVLHKSEKLPTTRKAMEW
jgi:hypothetical protein